MEHIQENLNLHLGLSLQSLPNSPQLIMESTVPEAAMSSDTPSPSPELGPTDNGLPIHSNLTNNSTSSISQEDLERNNFATLCHMIVSVAPLALRNVFNGIHPPLHLVADLQKPQTQVTLRRLRQLGVIDDAQWKVIFPKRKAAVNADKFDVVLLNILLKHMCSLSAPYPNGWTGVPIHSDKSITADMTRLNWFRTLLASKVSEPHVTNKEFQAYQQQLTSTLDRLGGVNCKIKADRAAREKLEPEDAHKCIQRLKVWEKTTLEVSSKEASLEKLARKRESGQHELANLIDHGHLQVGEEDDQDMTSPDSMQVTVNHVFICTFL